MQLNVRFFMRSGLFAINDHYICAFMRIFNKPDFLNQNANDKFWFHVYLLFAFRVNMYNVHIRRQKNKLFLQEYEIGNDYHPFCGFVQFVGVA